MMKVSLRVIIILGVLLGLAASWTDRDLAKHMQVQGQKEDWLLDESSGIPVWIVLNDVVNGQVFPRRSLFVFVETESFNESNVNRIFVALAKAFPEPKNLFITLLTDKTMILQAVHQHLAQVICPGTNNTIEEKNSLAVWDKARFTGYYRAVYARIEAGDERFAYSPDPLEGILVEKFINKTSL
jgi:hypothetical protein